MATLLEMVLSNLLVASALALGVAGLARILKRPALIHCLWVLVFLKLVTPPVVSVPVFPAGASPLQAESAAVEVSPRPVPENRLTSTADGEGAVVTVEPDRSVFLPATRTTPEGRTLPAPAAGLRVPWLECLLGIWGLGILAVFGLALWRTRRFRYLVRLAEPVPAAVQDRAEGLARRLGLARCPRVWRVPARISPLVWALLERPRLLLPARLLETLSREEVDCLLAHELAHVRRRDHLVRLLELVVAGLFWWFPVVWLARRALRSAEEQCCDAWVIWSLPRRAEAYARALVKTVEFLAGARLAMPPAASGARHVRQLERRLTMIMERTPPRALTVAGRLAVAGLAVLMLSVLPTFAQEDTSEKEIQRIEMKLERVERAMSELRAAGLKEEVVRLEKVAEKLRARLDPLRVGKKGARMRARNKHGWWEKVDPKARDRDVAKKLEALECMVVELEKKLEVLEREGRRDEARRVAEKIQTTLAKMIALRDSDRIRYINGKRVEDPRDDWRRAARRDRVEILEKFRHVIESLERKLDSTNRKYDALRAEVERLQHLLQDRGRVKWVVDYQQAAVQKLQDLEAKIADLTLHRTELQEKLTHTENKQMRKNLERRLEEIEKQMVQLADEKKVQWHKLQKEYDSSGEMPKRNKVGPRR